MGAGAAQVSFARYEELPDVMYVSDVARYLRLSERAVRHYIDTGVIKADRLGGRIIIPKRKNRKILGGEDTQ